MPSAPSRSEWGMVVKSAALVGADPLPARLPSRLVKAT